MTYTTYVQYVMHLRIDASNRITLFMSSISCLEANIFIRAYGLHSRTKLSSVSCQFSDIGSHNQLSNEQKWSESEQKQSVSEQTRSFARNVPYRKLLVTRESYTDG